MIKRGQPAIRGTVSVPIEGAVSCAEVSITMLPETDGLRITDDEDRDVYFPSHQLDDLINALTRARCACQLAQEARPDDLPTREDAA